MKIVIINGSPRKNGATAKILNEVSIQLSCNRDVDIQYYQLSELKLNFCSGCCKCFELGKCVMNDDVEKLSDVIAEADGIVIGSPVYASNVSAQLKVLIDRGHFVMEQLLKDKATFGIVTYENAGARSALRVLKNLFLFSGSANSLNMLVKIPFNADPLMKSNLIESLHSKCMQFYKSISKKRKPITRKLLQDAIFNIGLKPFIMAKGESYRGVLNRLQERGIKYN